MQAVTFREFGAPDVLQVSEVDRPEPGADDVLVRIGAAGICYHDVLSRGGKIPGKPGRILGHEIAGEIVAGGANVPPERMGERVVLYQRLFCGTCRNCLRGRQDLCRYGRVLGEQGGGGYAEFTCVPARNAVRIPDGLDMTAAALAVCPVGTSVRAALGIDETRDRIGEMRTFGRGVTGRWQTHDIDPGCPSSAQAGQGGVDPATQPVAFSIGGAGDVGRPVEPAREQ